MIWLQADELLQMARITQDPTEQRRQLQEALRVGTRVIVVDPPLISFAVRICGPVKCTCLPLALPLPYLRNESYCLVTVVNTEGFLHYCPVSFHSFCVSGIKIFFFLRVFMCWGTMAAESQVPSTENLCSTLFKPVQLTEHVVSRCGPAVRRLAGKQKDLGLICFGSPFSSLQKL